MNWTYDILNKKASKPMSLVYSIDMLDGWKAFNSYAKANQYRAEQEKNGFNEEWFVTDVEANGKDNVQILAYTLDMMGNWQSFDTQEEADAFIADQMKTDNWEWYTPEIEVEV